MKNKKITRKITQGMYILTTNGGGCVVDSVSQVSAEDHPLIAVAVMKKNYTNELMHKNDTFALSVLGVDVNPNMINTFGFYSMRDIDKFESIKTNEVENLKVINDSLGYMICKKVDSIDNTTHTLFIGKLIEADAYQEGPALSYGYYQEHKEEFVKVKTEKGQDAWVCMVCGYVYYGDTLPEEFQCPVCGVGVAMFKKQ